MSKWIEEKELASYPEITDGEVKEAMDRCVRRVEKNLDEFTDHFPGANSIDRFYVPGENLSWTTGFWTGELWLSYENEKDPAKKEELKQAAEKQVASFLKRIETRNDTDHHDMGFLYSPSCVSAYKLTGSEEGRRAAILAADQLIERFHPVGEFLQAWGRMDAPDNYRFIIDCLLNLPLLYWASDETKDDKYRQIAEKHIHTAMNNVIREDDSTWHTVFMNPQTGLFDHGATCQGYRDGSAWARGQAWGIYGTAVAYKYTGREEYFTYFKRVTTYFLNHLPADLIPYWDLTFGDGDGPELTDETAGASFYTDRLQPRDSSSDVIAACGMLEMAKYLKEEDASYYRSIARKLLKAVKDHCASFPEEISNGQVLHGTYSHHSPYNTCKPEGTDECVIWGDYYYMEALHRILTPNWKIYW